MALARLKNRGHEVLRGLIGRAARFTGALIQTRRTFLADNGQSIYNRYSG